MQRPSKRVRGGGSLQRVAVGAAVRVRWARGVRERLGRSSNASDIAGAPGARRLGPNTLRTSLNAREPLLRASGPAAKSIQVAMSPRRPGCAAQAFAATTTRQPLRASGASTAAASAVRAALVVPELLLRGSRAAGRADSSFRVALLILSAMIVLGVGQPRRVLHSQRWTKATDSIEIADKDLHRSTGQVSKISVPLETYVRSAFVHEFHSMLSSALNDRKRTRFLSHACG